MKCVSRRKNSPHQRAVLYWMIFVDFVCRVSRLDCGCGRGVHLTCTALLDVEDVSLHRFVLLEALDDTREAAFLAVAHVHKPFHAFHGEHAARESHHRAQRHIHRRAHHHLAVGGTAGDDADAEGDEVVEELARRGNGDVAKAAVRVEFALGIRHVLDYGRTVQRGELFHRDSAFLFRSFGEVVVVGRGFAVVRYGGVGICGCDVHGRFEADILRGRADHDAELAAFDVPILDEHVVVRERAAVESDGHFLFLAGMQEYFDKAFELFLRAEDAAFLVGDVQLGDFGTVAFADVLHFERDGERLALFDVVCGKAQIGILELRVRESVAEGIEHGLIRRFVVAVADVDALAVLHAPGPHGEVACHDVVAVLERERFGELAGRIDVAVDEVVRRLAGGLSAEVEVEDRTGVRLRFAERDGRAAGEDEDDVLVHLGDLLDEHVVRIGHIEVLAVEPFGFVLRGEPDEYQHRVLAFRLFHGFLDEARAVTVAPHFVAGRVVVFLPLGVHGVEEGRDFRGIDEAGAGTLIARSLCERADDGDLLRGGEGEGGAFVLEEHGAVCRDLRRQRVVRAEVGLDVLILARLAFEGELDEPQYDFVQLFLGEGAVFHRFDDILVVRAAVAGHFEIHTGLDASHSVIHRAPVADDDALEAPFDAEHIREHALVVGKVGAGKTVVGAHDGRGLFCFDDVLERGKVYLSERAFVHDGVDAHAEMFLIVGAEMFEGYADAVFLNAVHPCRTHSACEERILGEILEVPAAERGALDVDAGAEYGGNSQCLRFRRDRRAFRLDELRVPCACRGDGRGEAGRGIGLLHDVDCAGGVLFASESVGTVGHAHGRNAVIFQRSGVPESEAGAKRGFFVEGKIFKYVGSFCADGILGYAFFDFLF